MITLIKKAIKLIADVVTGIETLVVDKQLNKRPQRIINRRGYEFHLKPVRKILSVQGDSITRGNFAAVYHSHDNVYVIGLDKYYFKLKPRTRRFVLEHEIAHITHNIHNPTSDIDIETQVDIIAANKLRLNKPALRNCLRDLLRNTNRNSIRRILKTRINNI